jgi:hypothetical protein
VDFIAMRIPVADLHDALGKELQADEAIWLYGGEENQALILARHGRGGELLLRYLPAAHVRQRADGAIEFERGRWRAKLPLRIWEDEKLIVPVGASREAWLSQWHSDLEWLRALHLTTYSNGVIQLQEQFGRHIAPGIAADVPGLTPDEQLIRRFRRRQRILAETDLLVLANNHWNFDVRGFNPGGNHGSFRRVSAHSLLMLAGGAQTDIPRGLVISEPYDSLSFVPTVLALTAQLAPSQQNTPVRFAEEQPRYPGRIIAELFATPTQPVTTSGKMAEAPGEVKRGDSP